MSAIADTWIVLGGSSPIARAFARELARPDRRIILAGRDLDDLKATATDLQIATGASAEAFAFDAADLSSHGAAASLWAESPGPLNVVLLFAAMPEQAEMDADPSKLESCVAVTYVGAISILHHLAPHIERRKTGTVIGIGSVAGDRGRIKNYIYGSAKAGLHTYLSGLRNRLARAGAHVLTVKLGFADTGMTWGAPGVFLVASPDSVARHCLRAAGRRRNVCYVPSFWWAIMLVIRHIPEAIFKRLSI